MEFLHIHIINGERIEELVILEDDSTRWTLMIDFPRENQAELFKLLGEPSLEVTDSDNPIMGVWWELPQTIPNDFILSEILPFIESVTLVNRETEIYVEDFESLEFIKGTSMFFTRK